MSYDPALCNYFWGSHGCDLAAGHAERDGTVHECTVTWYEDDDEGTCTVLLCCEHDGGTRVRWEDDGPWKEYGAGWYGE